MTTTTAKRRRGRKYHPGHIIDSMEELAGHLEAGEWIFLHNTPKHPGVLTSMTYRTLQTFLRGRSLRVAITYDVPPGEAGEE